MTAEKTKVLHGNSVSRCVCEFLDVATHTILFSRAVYPPECFDTVASGHGSQPTSGLGVPSQYSLGDILGLGARETAARCRAPAVQKYIKDSVFPLEPLFLAGAVDRFAIVILAQQSQAPKQSRAEEDAAEGSISSAAGQIGGDVEMEERRVAALPPLAVPVERFVFEFVMHGRCAEVIDAVTGLQHGECAGISPDQLSDALTGMLSRITTCGGSVGDPASALSRACSAHNSNANVAKDALLLPADAERTFMLAAETRPARDTGDAVSIVEDIRTSSAWMDCSHDPWHQQQLQMRAPITSSPSLRPPTQYPPEEGSSPTSMRPPRQPGRSRQRGATESGLNESEEGKMSPSAREGQVVLTPLRSLDLVCGTLQLYVEHFFAT